jgi:hypothetical protein
VNKADLASDPKQEASQDQGNNANFGQVAEWPQSRQGFGGG